ncbi:hypothetical protein [Amphibacillus cookii]|uniref:hypothetical protein n=1 Tax=Amphibacillus cookii TaxID=767787 RepID=UPI00195E7B62|nr:hypothetical protein [Amphibacillus cookii]MBM7542734.1 hypothetical protein [Amphibacillus cookii]
MRKKIAVLIVGIIIVISIILAVLFKRDDQQKIVEEINAMNLPLTDVGPIEFVDNDHALAIFLWSGIGHIGVAELDKTLFGWDISRATSEFLSGDVQFVELNHFSVIQTWADPSVQDVSVELENGVIDSAQILIKEGDTKKGEISFRNWLYYSDTEDLSNAIVTTYDKDGEVVEVIEVPDQPNEGLDRTVE